MTCEERDIDLVGNTSENPIRTTRFCRVCSDADPEGMYDLHADIEEFIQEYRRNCNEVECGHDICKSFVNRTMEDITRLSCGCYYHLECWLGYYRNNLVRATVAVSAEVTVGNDHMVKENTLNTWYGSEFVMVCLHCGSVTEQGCVVGRAIREIPPTYLEVLFYARRFLDFQKRAELLRCFLARPLV